MFPHPSRCGAPSVLSSAPSSFPPRLVGDSGGRPGRSLFPIPPPPVRLSASPDTLGFVADDGLGGEMVKDSPVVAPSVEPGAGRGGENGGESRPLVFLRGEVGGDSPMTWSRLGKFA